VKFPSMEVHMKNLDERNKLVRRELEKVNLQRAYEVRKETLKIKLQAEQKEDNKR
jgi:hypothetical protein